ncbi:reverse transcriptase [Lasius niger]|uniref:Reverse transcriptase n=1 Tax=Lasius niger TaxID=67767 RepID=A0A0J7NCZ4_LASNI|nr:reverse transcriptase [Lasius niger]
MPNLKGPDERRRRLFANVVLSVLLYGAPVWGDELVTSHQRHMALNRLMGSVAQRVISAYRTVSGDAAFLLARIPPLRFLAPMRKKVYAQLKRLKDDGSYTPETRDAVKEAEFLNMCEQWRAFLERPNTPGEYTKMAVVPHLESWMRREHGSLSFHLTQILTGHGCFANFLRRIGKRAVDSCDFCGEGDSAIHTLRECPAWDWQRIVLKRALGLNRDFAPIDIIDAIAGNWEHWYAFSAFTEEVMREKEEEERRRERVRRAATSPSSEEEGSG